MGEGTTINFPIQNRRALVTRPDRSAEIRAAALEIHACKFVACRDQEYAFTHGTILSWLHKNGRLTAEHLKAAQRIIEDLKFAVGRSETRIVAANDVYDSLKLLIDDTLTGHERLVFVQVFTQNYFQADRDPEALMKLGTLLSGYKNKPQAEAAASRSIQALLEQVSAYYEDLSR